MFPERSQIPAGKRTPDAWATLRGYEQVSRWGLAAGERLAPSFRNHAFDRPANRSRATPVAHDRGRCAAIERAPGPAFERASAGGAAPCRALGANYARGKSTAAR